MTRSRKALGFVLAVAILAVVGSLVYTYGQNAAFPPGFQVQGGVPSGYAVSSLTSGQGAFGATTSSLTVTIEGGQLVCPAGDFGYSPTNTMTLLANTTYLIVYNCQLGFLYAKTAVTAPGGQSGSTAAGTPGTFLAAVPGVEVPIVQAVAGASTVSLTDKRPTSAFSLSHLNLPAANKDVAGTCTASSSTTCTITFANAFQVAPVCVVTDQTTQQASGIKALPSTTTLTITTASSSDVFSYICWGNPN
jgi:hypothetical protein